MRRPVHNMLADQDLELASPSRLESPAIKSRASQVLMGPIFQKIWGEPQLQAQYVIFNQKATASELSIKIGITKDEFEAIKSNITKILQDKLGVTPASIELFRDPEDGEEKIIVAIPLGTTDDPLEDLLSIKRKLRKIDRELAREIVLMPAD